MRERGKKVIWPGARVALEEMMEPGRRDKIVWVEKAPRAA